MEEVVIVGAGIAGLATAVALKKVGVQALVLERAEGLRATGAALGLFPNAWHALDALGVSDKLNSLYAPFFKSGDEQRVVHRKVLLQVLAEELPPNTIRFSSKLTSIETQVEQGSSICIVALEDGTIIKSKVVIGCDGVHSRIARWLGLGSPVDSGGLRFVGWPCTHKAMGADMGGDPNLLLREVVDNLAKDFPALYLDIVGHSDLSTLTWAPLMFRYPWDVVLGNLTRKNVTVAETRCTP
ncbi:hypothetical protein NL676_014075 [Syzygium grande]|nr:hypothetical protein NL676_014075 [Syzygium grande]